MNSKHKRRYFVKNALMACGGLIALSPIQALAKNRTKEKSVYGMTHQTDLSTEFFGKRLKISGQVFDRDGKNPVAGAMLEFWHLSPNSNHYGHKGMVKTNENGYYQIISDMPNWEKGKSKTVHFRLPNSTTVSETTLKFTDYNAFITDNHWEVHNGLPDRLLFPKLEKSFNTTKIKFNLSTNQKI
jgi:hypothetical protein